ncbi:hypothetical protein BKA81DRAFT_401861 [Phyllosticta paracitricarpa]|uniref:Uncharacterized protein n=1 Tax=Phyllosticta paracitricarpa TaxID=2016321 RepID=A0ABR1MWU2_9PEZI
MVYASLTEGEQFSNSISTPCVVPLSIILPPRAWPTGKVDSTQTQNETRVRSSLTIDHEYPDISNRNYMRNALQDTPMDDSYPDTQPIKLSSSHEHGLRTTSAKQLPRPIVLPPTAIRSRSQGECAANSWPLAGREETFGAHAYQGTG